MLALIRLTEAKNDKEETIYNSDAKEMVNVEIITFDNEEDLEKYKNIMPWYVQQVNQITETQVKTKIKI